jgi:hypothetical protein
MYRPDVPAYPACMRPCPNNAVRLKIPFGINEGPRSLTIQLIKLPHRLSEQEPAEKAGRQCTYLLNPAYDAGSALIPAVS